MCFQFYLNIDRLFKEVEKMLIFIRGQNKKWEKIIIGLWPNGQLNGYQEISTCKPRELQHSPKEVFPSKIHGIPPDTNSLSNGHISPTTLQRSQRLLFSIVRSENPTAKEKRNFLSLLELPLFNFCPSYYFVSFKWIPGTQKRKKLKRKAMIETWRWKWW